MPPLTATILCVDDDEDDLYFIREAISTQPYPLRVDEAHDGWEAMSYLENALATNALPSLVIMDINMPRMDGKQAVKKIREYEAFSRIPIAIFTTSSNVTDRKHFENQGVHFLTKPFDYKTFTRQIIDLLALYTPPNA